MLLDVSTVNIRSFRPWAVLAVACLATFAIMLDTNIVNVALPSLTREMGANTRDLQWVVDAYNLTFAALVLGAGSLGDRYGRRPILMTGLVGFAAASAVGAVCTSPGQLIVTRLVMGLFGAMIFPTTLSVITNAYPDRAERAKAIGIWGAVVGAAVAVGPVCGGLLLEHFWWGSVFLALVPVALISAILTVLLVPESRDAAAGPVDVPGVLAASATVGLLVYTIIEAPHRGWHAPLTAGGFALTAVLAAVFIFLERRAANPMLDLSVFRNRAFSAASASVTVAFFALFGFIFLVTQYFQFVRGYDALSTGVRILPVAVSIAAGATLGPLTVARVGTRAVVMSGLTLLGGSFAWIAVSPTFLSYPVIVIQMLLMGLGLGLTQVPATDSIMSVLPPAKAGVGSAINDATREAGGTLGVAVVGSVFVSIFGAHLGGSVFAALPGPALATAKSSVGAAMAAAHQFGGAPLLAVVDTSFMSAFHIGSIVAAAVCCAGAVLAGLLPGPTVDSGNAAHAPVEAAPEQAHRGPARAGSRATQPSAEARTGARRLAGCQSRKRSTTRVAEEF